jgi:hypothetical protein
VSLALILLAPVAVILAAIVFGIILPRRRRRVLRHGPIALAPFGRQDRASIPPRPTNLRPERDPLAVTPPAVERVVAAAPAPPQSFERPRSPELDVAQEDRGRVLHLQVAGERSNFSHSPPTLRLARAHDGTLQFLPGRLEVIEGRDAGQEIRFVRTPGPEGASVTFGRSDGPEYRHVQLHEATVSRLHAKMALDGKTWALVNLSRTNPVAVNGLALEGEGSSVILREGDRIEMGEVVFKYRQK